MTLLMILKLASAALTMIVGAVALIWPQKAGSFTGLPNDTARGTSEIRAVLGGLFIGLGLAVILFRSPGAYRTLGIGYLAIAAARAFSIFADDASTRSNWISLVSEVALGVLLVI
ncbi:DUF4345 family protein [Candidatus Bipolaricaulota bacterium]|nr:DUF4345 family protein [Candidatus Bipolaricaulota bacterium]